MPTAALTRLTSALKCHAIARPDGIGHAANLIGFSTHRAATRRRRTLRMYLRLRLGARLCGALSTLGRGSTGVCQGIGVSSQIVPFPNRSSNAEFVRDGTCMLNPDLAQPGLVKSGLSIPSRNKSGLSNNRDGNSKKIFHTFFSYFFEDVTRRARRDVDRRAWCRSKSEHRR